MHDDCDVTVLPGVTEWGLEALLLTIDDRISITSIEYVEAWARLRRVKAALIEGFQEPVYINGSIEHGDALTPLNDIDLGIIFGEPVTTQEMRRSPTGLMGHVCEAIEKFANDQYPGISAGFIGQKRSVVVRFGTGHYSTHQDFTADVIVALDYPEGRGVLVPNLLIDGWDRSDPITHSKMIRHANSLTGSALNRVVRIVKQWNRKNGEPLSSWNIKALALSCLTRPTSLTEGLHTFFRYAAKSLASGLTPDPAGIASPIGLESPRDQVLACLRQACSMFDRVIMSADSGRLDEARESLEGFLSISHVEVDRQAGSKHRPLTIGKLGLVESSLTGERPSH